MENTKKNLVKNIYINNNFRFNTKVLMEILSPPNVNKEINTDSSFSSQSENQNYISSFILKDNSSDNECLEDYSKSILQNSMVFFIKLSINNLLKLAL